MTPMFRISLVLLLTLLMLTLLLTGCSSAPTPSLPPLVVPAPAIPPLPASARQLPRSETLSAQVQRSLDALLPKATMPAPAASSASATTTH